MSTQAEENICTAPPGKFRIVHIDPRDHWPAFTEDKATLAEVRQRLDSMFAPMREAMKVFDDSGKEIDLRSLTPR